jgi:hypothetical protein
MNTNSIKCPACGEVIEIAAALAKELEAGLKSKYHADLAVAKTKLEERLHDEKEALRGQIEAEAKERAQNEAQKASDEAKRHAQELQEALSDANVRLKTSQDAELELRRAQRKLEDDKRAFELEATRKLDAAKSELLLKARQEADEDHRYKDQEKDKKLSDMLAQIEDLKRKAEQQSQQGQGEVLELDIERRLREAFPHDEVSEVGKGIKGADCVQVCKTPDGRELGRIVWECKRTKAFSGTWPQKVKDDMRAAKADICCIITETMPDDVKGFGVVDGAWVCSIPLAIALAGALRQALEEKGKALSIKAGRASKAEDVYDYLTGSEFKNRVQAMVEAYAAMRDDLEAEKRALSNHWARREKQLDRVSAQLGGMHGDLSGIVGDKLPGVKALELPGEEK